MTGLRLDHGIDTAPMVHRHRMNRPGRKGAERGPPRPEEVVAFLSAPGTFGPGRAERIDTHISHIFLYGARAWKLKRPVKTSFLDFSTATARRRACQNELDVNRRMSGDLYVRLCTVTQEPEGLALDGPGRPVDWLVEMRRFSTDEQFDVLARRGKLTEEMITRLARRVARIHEEAPRRTDCGGAREMRTLAADTISGLSEFACLPGGRRSLSKLSLSLRAELDATARLMDLRRRFGCVRHCHADLHLANICLHRGEPTPFDAIEFDDRMASIDVVYDMAFTVMDLIHEGLDDLANRFLNAWLESGRDYAGLRLLPLCMALRAAIRARVLLLTARLSAPGRAEMKIETARSYFNLARRLARTPRPLLLAVGGLSGSGKSTLARCLAPDVTCEPGAVILRSDVIRKRLHGQPPEEPLPDEAYRPEVSERVFTQMFKDAGRALRARSAVILDATFLDGHWRERAATLACRHGIPFTGLWLEAPDDILIPRIAGRSGDASDATAEVLARQRKAGAGLVGWTRIDASGSPIAVRLRARKALSESGYLAPGTPCGRS